MEINALPDDNRVDGDVFNLEYLRQEGYLKAGAQRTDSFSSDDEITYVFDDDTAYFEGVDRDSIPEIAKGLRKRRGFDYYWFWEPDRERLEVLRTWGDNKQFSYDPRIHKGSTRRNKIDKLSSIGTDGIAHLFDIKDVADRFYNELWDHRLDLAACLKDETDGHLSDTDAVLSAQRTIDRLVFTYFLMNKGIMLVVLPNGDPLKTTPQATFGGLVEDVENFGSLLNTLFFDYLGDSSQATDSTANEAPDRRLPISGTERSLYVPCLNSGLFRAHDLSDADGSTSINEDDIEVADFDWKALVDDLNQYNWVLDDYRVERSSDREVKGTLTPEILGSIYERFVITVSEIDDLTLDNLRTTFQGDVDQMRKGNREIGAYYTPEDVVDEITTTCLWSYVHDCVPETREYDSFDEFFEDTGSTDLLREVDAALGEAEVCDPAVGSGHFLMAMGDKLENWRLKCDPTHDIDRLRNDIVLNNLYGVDILEGAADICRLRMWLWLAAGQDLSDGADHDAIPLGDVDNEGEKLPSVDYNIRTGNSLVGFASRVASVDEHDFLSIQSLKGQIEEYSNNVDEGKRSYEDELSKAIEQRHESLRRRVDERYTTYLNAVAEAENDPRKIHFSTGDEFLTTTAGDSSAYVYLKSKNDLPAELNELFPSDYTKTTKGEVDSGDFDTVARQVDAIGPDQLKQAYIETEFDEDELKNGNPKPVHWIIEFPNVFSGEEPGFDIAIGNPPYGNGVLDENQTEWVKQYASNGCGDICGFFVERQNELLRDGGIYANVIAASLVANKSMTPVREYMREEMSDIKLSYFGTRPSRIFDDIEERVSIAYGRRGTAGREGIYTSRNIRFAAEDRATLFDSIDYSYADDLRLGDQIGSWDEGDDVFLPKVGPEKSREILLKLKRLSEDSRTVGDVESGSGNDTVEFRETAGYWLHALRNFPYSNTKINTLGFDSSTDRDVCEIIVNSSLFYFYFVTYGNNRDVYRPYVQHFPFPSEQSISEHEAQIEELANRLDTALETCFDPAVGRNGEFDNESIRGVIDECDDLLGTLFGFSAETVEYLQSYDEHIRPGRE